jgi:RNA polymerase sigma-70 factor, ECF subfamily
MTNSSHSRIAPPAQRGAARVDPEDCYRRYGPMVLRRCRYLLRDDERARDAMHDVFVKVLRYRERLDDAAPSRLLYRIATNVCLNLIRSARRRPEVAGDALADQAAPGADPESTAVSRAALSRLFGEERDSTMLLAILHYQDGLSLNEVAREVGLSASGVRRRLLGLRERMPALASGAAPRALP